MLNKVAWQTSTRAADRQVAAPEEPIIDLVEVCRALRRRAILITSILVLAISGALFYLATTPPRYTATTMLLFDVRKTEPFQQQGNSNAAADSAFVDSQVEILRAENIARSVIGNLNLRSDPEFAPDEVDLLATIRGFIQETVKAVLGASKNPTQSNQLGRLVRMFQANLTIRRVGLTYVVSVGYRSLDPNKAARISNAVAEAYIAGELESKYQAARRANVWLQDRVNELKTLAQNTERAVAEYKAKNNVVGTATPSLDEQQLADLSSQRRVVLKDLESSAQTYRALHEALLQRVAEFTQQQSFPATEARVVSPASPPLEKSEPKGLLVLGVASLLGLVAGLGAAFAREHLDNGLRSSDQVEKKIGIDCLGMLPTISHAQATPKELRHRRWLAKWRNPSGQAQAASGDRVISTAAGRYRFVVDKPFCRFAETIRSLKVAAETAGSSGRTKVIGVTSALPREGKSLVAANLSEMIAVSDSKAILIDGDSRNRGLTRQLAPQAEAGLMHVIAGRAALEELVWRDPNTNLDFLPAGPPMEASNPVGIVAMQKFLESMRDRYDYVIFDLPPIAPVADVKAASHLIDYFILVIEWGRTSQEAVIDVLNTAPLVSEKLLGAVLNNADSTALKRLESYKGHHYDYNKAYSS